MLTTAVKPGPMAPTDLKDYPCASRMTAQQIIKDRLDQLKREVARLETVLVYWPENMPKEDEEILVEVAYRINRTSREY